MIFFTKFQGGAVAAVQHPTRRPWYALLRRHKFINGLSAMVLKSCRYCLTVTILYFNFTFTACKMHF